MNISLGPLAFFYLTSVIAHSPVTHNAEQDLACMAHAIYFEAGNQDYEGKTAVANVIMNRVESSSYPDTICEVVTQRKQFSYLEDVGRHRLVIRNNIDKIAYLESLAVGYGVAEGRLEDNTGGATHYYAYKIVTPHWSNAWSSKKKIGDHIFLTMR